MLFENLATYQEKDYDVILGHRHVSSPVVNGKHTVQPTIQLQAILRFLKKKVSQFILLHHATCNRRQQTA